MSRMPAGQRRFTKDAFICPSCIAHLANRGASPTPRRFASYRGNLGPPAAGRLDQRYPQASRLRRAFCNSSVAFTAKETAPTSSRRTSPMLNPFSSKVDRNTSGEASSSRPRESTGLPSSIQTSSETGDLVRRVPAKSGFPPRKRRPRRASTASSLKADHIASPQSSTEAKTTHARLQIARSAALRALEQLHNDSKNVIITRRSTRRARKKHASTTGTSSKDVRSKRVPSSLAAILSNTRIVNRSETDQTPVSSNENHASRTGQRTSRTSKLKGGDISSDSQTMQKSLIKPRTSNTAHNEPHEPQKKPIVSTKPSAFPLDEDTSRWEASPLPNDIKFTPVTVDQPPVPTLAYGLERVLFNPGVYRLQDPRSNVYNFDPYLEEIMPASEFDFDALRKYVTSSEDENLLNIARTQGKRYTGSTSSLTNMLSHLHFLLSAWREPNMSMLSKKFPSPLRSYTQLSRAPAATFLRYRDGVYAIDADKEFSTANILSMLGRSMEKMLTLDTKEYERYRKSNSTAAKDTADEKNDAESFHYTSLCDWVLRSQLDAHDSRLPGTGMFDLKTRAVVSVRMNVDEYEKLRDYEIVTNLGEWESFEREYHDMIRAAFLKYSLQVRMGRMDGIFVAYHNTQRIFGFQYIPLSEMDQAIHGQTDPFLGHSEFKLSMQLLNVLIDKATERFPGQSLRLLIETRESVAQPFMYFFAEPVTNADIDSIQEQGAEYTREVETALTKTTSLNDGPADKGSFLPATSTLASEINGGIQDAHLEALYDLDDSQQSEAEAFEASTLIANLPEETSQHESSHNAAAAYAFEQLHHRLDADAIDRPESLDVNMLGSLEGAADASLRVEYENDIAIRSYDEDVDVADISDVTATRPPDGIREPEHAASDPAAIAVGAGSVSSEKSCSDPSPSSSSSLSPSPPDSKLLALRVLVQHKVGSDKVIRPNEVHAQSKWEMSYRIEEFTQDKQKWTKYRASQARRKNLLSRDREFAKTYISKLESLSRRGRKRRLNQTRRQEDVPPVVVGMPSDHSD